MSLRIKNKVISKDVVVYMLFVAVFALALPYLSYSAVCNGLCNPLSGVGSIEELLVKITKVVSYVAAPFLVLAYMYVGFNYVLARGNADKIKKTHDMFMWVVIATILILGAPILVEMLQATVDALKQ